MLLSEVGTLYRGGTRPKAIYRGDVKVWPSPETQWEGLVIAVQSGHMAVTTTATTFPVTLPLGNVYLFASHSRGSTLSHSGVTGMVKLPSGSEPIQVFRVGAPSPQVTYGYAGQVSWVAVKLNRSHTDVKTSTGGGNTTAQVPAPATVLPSLVCYTTTIGSPWNPTGVPVYTDTHQDTSYPSISLEWHVTVPAPASNRGAEGASRSENSVALGFSPA